MLAKNYSTYQSTSAKENCIKDKEFLIEGIKGVNEALDSNLEVILIVIEGSRRDEKEFIDLIKS